MPVDESTLDWSAIGPDDTGFRRKQLGDADDGDQLGCSLYELPAGERSWPYHYHTENEEAVYVLAGTGLLRLDDDEHSLSAGTYVALPTGEAHAHRIINDGDETLRYLVVSTMDDPDVVGYPDAGAVGVYAGSPPGGNEDERELSGFFDPEDRLDFWSDVAGADER